MQIRPRSRLTLILAGFITGCAPPSLVESETQTGPPTSAGPAVVGVDAAAYDAADALVQFSLLAALAAGDYGDGAPLSEIRKHGDFGLGTFDRLDGEMIVLDGNVYQVVSDGTVRQRNEGGSTPFATVTFFNEDGRFKGVSATSLSELDDWFDRRLRNAQVPVAIRLHGDMAELTLRSAPPQTPPYRPLAKVIDQQKTWQRRDVRGTLIGFRCPEWMGTLNVSGYHWHFLSDDRVIGGHVLDCRFNGATAAYDECATVLIHLPNTESFEEVDMSIVTRADVDKIERQRMSK